MSDSLSDSPATRLMGSIHRRAVHRRRVRVLARGLASMLPRGSSLLDVGCGDGRVGALLRESVAQLKVEGVEILPRAGCAIECHAFDGTHLPFADNSFDCCLLVDVLHHLNDPLPLLREARRVASQFIVIKDHLSENGLDYWTLRFMDWVGNAPHGVVLPYAYLSRAQWQAIYREIGVTQDRTTVGLPLYSFPFSAIFGRKLHFISRLKKEPLSYVSVR